MSEGSTPEFHRGSDQQIESSDALRDRLFKNQLDRVNLIDALGIAVVAVFVPIALWRDMPHERLLIWAVALWVPLLAWISERGRDDGYAPAVWVWMSAALWAILPWLSVDAMASDHVAWILLFVAAYGAATDALLVPQTFDTEINWLILGYLVSFLVAFAVFGHWVQLFGLVALLLHLGAGVIGWAQVKAALLTQQAQSERQAMIDPLTSLPSRRAAIAEIDRLLGTGPRIHCVLVDIDDFKAINNQLGHHAGDRVLQRLASVLERELGESWFVARLGGDEFVAVGAQALEHEKLKSLTSIELAADNLNPTHIVNLSIGTTDLISAEATPDRVLTEGSTALRQAKNTGKGRIVVVDDELRRHETERQLIARKTSEAMATGDIIAWGQTICDLSTRRPVGVELLARWPQSDGSMIPPTTFVPVIEAQGLSIRLGEQMMRRGINLIRTLSDVGDGDSFVTVNLSARHLLVDDLPRWLSRELELVAADPGRLVLEITESQYLSDAPTWRTTIDRIRSLHVGVAIDDLGTGYSSISRVVDAPFSHVKVDRSVLSALDRRGGLRFLESIRAFAANAGQTVIAEGIETEDELSQLRGAGFELGQGFLLSRPEPLHEIVSRFEEPLWELDQTEADWQEV